jgi:drug/metabolite transporter (DMT)-like permease
MSSSSFAFGVSAAVAAPFVMTVGFIFWDNNWHGSTFSLNLFKCNLAAVCFLIVSFATRGSSPFPESIFTLEKVGFLMLSSTIGIIIGDFLWLEGLRLLGARRVIVVDAIKPFLSAFLGWAILGEQLRYPAFGGMALTVAGVLVVSIERTAMISTPAEVVSASDEQIPSSTLISPTADATSESMEINAQHTSVVEKVGARERTTSLVDVETSAANNSVGVQESLELPAASETIDLVEEPKRQGSLRENRTNTTASLRQGYIMSVLNVVLDTYGSVLTKQYGVGMTTWEISLIRFGFAGAVMFLVSVAFYIGSRCLRMPTEQEALATNGDDEAIKDIKDKYPAPWYLLPTNMSRKSWLKVVAGVGLVTFLTPALSNYALFQIALALALTLGSVGPLYALPLSWLLQSDKPSLRACFGAGMAVAGVIVLSLFGTLD